MRVSKQNLRGITLGLMVIGMTIMNGQLTEAAKDPQEHKDMSSICAPITPYAEMTSTQKAEVKARHAQMLEWHKKDLKEAVTAGKLTQQEADARLAGMQSMFKNMQDGKMKMHGAEMGQHDKHKNNNEHSQHR